MNELLLLLEQLNANLEKQIHSFNDFIVLLDQEEDAIAKYNFTEIERSVISKDQSIRIAESLENKRVAVMNKICYMIAFDTRKKTVSLPEFKTVFASYIDNVRKLLTSDVIASLEDFYNKFIRLTDEFNTIFKTASQRIYRNKLILKKVLHHIHLSLSIFESESHVGMNYDALGKTQATFHQQKSISSVRVQV